VPRKPRLIVTAGPTREMLDPVRFLSNVSTGHMGYAFAKIAKMKGFHVTLVSGPTLLKAPTGVHFVSVLTARQMKAAIRRVWNYSDILIMTAAVCDYTPVHFSTHKIKRIKHKQIKFRRTEDILGLFGKRKGKRVLVGFALETNRMTTNAIRKMKSKNCDMIVLNWYGRGHNPFGSNQTSMRLLYSGGEQKVLKRMPKLKTAGVILGEAVKCWEKKKKGSSLNL
jgi:phosphopantothenoylcysteine decarboxylase / phosphopantothenate---cysteine ligase